MTDEDILALATDVAGERTGYELQMLHISYGSNGVATSTVGIRKPDGTVVREAATGQGSVEAIYRTMERLLNEPVVLKDYRIQSTSSGPDSLAEVYVKVEYHGHVANGRGVDSDVLLASAKSFLDAINRVLLKEQFELVATGG
ncbi:hypothetical protein GCM10025857_11340 [Alicyclobacillus contaminans]|nr:hypothetical protein GCM10025857_11340 [Alicyclobacillus contaminans]